MTLEQWIDGDRTYENYLRMSQWQRARYFFGGWPKGLWLSLTIFPLHWWTWGFDTGQEQEKLGLGPLVIMLYI